MSATNDTTKQILEHCFYHGIRAKRHNVVGIPVRRAGVIVGLRPSTEVGTLDIQGYVPAGLFRIMGRVCAHAVPFYVEIKTGKDKLRPEQEGFIRDALASGCVIIVAKTLEDYLDQFNSIFSKDND